MLRGEVRWVDLDPVLGAEASERRPAPTSRADAAPAAEAAPADNARLSYDRETKRVYVEILDPKTGEVIQRLPPESAVSRMIELSDGRRGALVDSSA